MGNGTSDGSDGGQVTCRAGTPLVPETADFHGGTSQTTGTYAPGTYTITFTANACGLTATDSITFTVV